MSFYLRVRYVDVKSLVSVEEALERVMRNKRMNES